LYGLLENRPVVFSTHVVLKQEVQDAMRQYHRRCRGRGVWMEDCYFEALTGCTGDYLDGRLPLESERLDRRVFKITVEPAWFLERLQPMWDEMVEAKAVHLHSSGAAGERPAEPLNFEQLYSDMDSLERSAAQRLGMMRAILLKVAFRPKKVLREAIKGVERRTRLPELAASGPLTLVHIRRTDKSQDFKGGAQTVQEREAFDAGAAGHLGASLGTFSNTLLPWIEGATGHISSLFVMSDDWHAFEPQILQNITKGLQKAPQHVIFDPESARMEPKDTTTLLKGNEAWGHKASVGMYILASTFAIGKWADNIAGCGSSGVTQLAAQLMGGRLGVDPNSLGVWEDDSVNVAAAQAHRGEVAILAQQQVKTAQEHRGFGDFWLPVLDEVLR